MTAQKPEDLQNISVELKATAASFKSPTAVALIFTIRNDHDKKQEVCRYMTPFEGFYGDILEVRDNEGRKIEYAGKMVKRRPPGKEDFMKIRPGQSLSVTFGIHEDYPLPGPGDYTVRFVGREYMNGLPDSEAVEIVISGN